MLTIVYGSTMAVKEMHWKRRLAYSTISNLSYILLAAAMMSPLGLTAALCHLVVHAMMKICSFFCAGAVMHQTGKIYIDELDGMGRRMPVTFACLAIASLSLIGIPLFGGFISKWTIARSAFLCGIEGEGRFGVWSRMGFLAVAVLLYSALMTAVYMLTVLVRAYFPSLLSSVSETKERVDPNWMMLLPLVIFAVMIIGLGVHSQPLMDFLMKIGGEAG